MSSDIVDEIINVLVYDFENKFIINPYAKTALITANIINMLVKDHATDEQKDILLEDFYTPIDDYPPRRMKENVLIRIRQGNDN